MDFKYSSSSDSPYSKAGYVDGYVRAGKSGDYISVALKIAVEDIKKMPQKEIKGRKYVVCSCSLFPNDGDDGSGLYQKADYSGTVSYKA
jgi:hypothetical protein